METKRESLIALLNPLEEQIRMFWKAEFGLRAID